MSEPAGGGPRRGGLAAVAGAPRFSVAEAVGGPRGILEAVLPGFAFIVVLTITADLRLSLMIALAGAAVLLLARLVARQPVMPAVSGALGVGVCALAAWRTGEAADYYAPGLLINAVYALVFALSTLRWPRLGPVPVIGLVVGGLRGEGLAWRRDPVRVGLYRRLTWLWVGVFVARLAVQWPLYSAGAVAPLAVARLGMGLPLFAAVAWLTWMALRSTHAPDGGGDGRLSPSAPAAAGERPRSRRP